MRAIFTFFMLIAANGIATEKNCDDIYKRGERIGEGHNKVVYLLDPHKQSGQCWDEKACSSVVVKELLSQALKNNSVEEAISKLGLSVPRFALGSCLRDGKVISYEIEQRMTTLTKDKVREKPRFYAGKIQRRLERLHKNNFIHADMHVGNVFLSEDGNQVFLGDFDHAKVANQDDMAYEDFYASRIWTEEFPWQPLLYKYKTFDAEKNGKIAGAQIDKLAKAIGNYDLAVAISKIYRFEFLLRNEDRDFRKGFFLDFDNNGVLDQRDVKMDNEEERNAFEAFATPYNNYIQTNLVSPLTVIPPDRNLGKRLLSDRSPYSKEFPLLAQDVLIISGGDVSERRPFPAYSQGNFKRYVERNGYRAEFFSSNLAREYPYWHKILMVIDKLNNPKNKVVVWLDDDGIVNTASGMLEQYLNTYDKDLILARDPEAFAYVNTGLMIFRNSPTSMQILAKLLEIGQEGRIDADSAEGNWFATNHLMRCRQAFNCLHEQQALQELLQKKKRTANGVEDRRLDQDWSKFVAVVPQIDTRKGLNANLLMMEGSETNLSGISENGSLITFDGSGRSYSQIARGSKPDLPFFVQCAGLSQDKTKCVKNIANYESGTYEYMLSDFPKGPYKDTCSACELEGDYIVCQCVGSNGEWISSAVNISCQTEIQNNNGRLVCKATGELKACSQIYEKKALSNAICWRGNCDEAIVKEYSDFAGAGTDRRVADRIRQLGYAPPILKEGDCTRNETPQVASLEKFLKSVFGSSAALPNLVHYQIEAKVAPFTRDRAKGKLKEFNERIVNMIHELHKSNILYGDLSLDKILVDDQDNLYFASISNARSLSDRDPQKQKLFDQENFAASEIWAEYHDWQPFFYKYKVFDTNGSGKISDEELERLVNLSASREDAEVIAELYHESYESAKIAGAFADFHNDGSIEEDVASPGHVLDDWGFNPLGKLIKLSEVSVKEEYKNFVEARKKNYFIFNPDPALGRRVISREFPYNTIPLKAEDILIISGGDVTPTRSFPLFSRENFKQFAGNLGYRFQHYSGNFAAPHLGYWHKIYMILDKLASAKNRVVVWLDDDGAVNMNSHMLERYLQAYPNKDVIVAKDPEEYAYVNTGALIFRNTPRSLLLLRSILRVGHSNNNFFMKASQAQCLHEQQSLQELLQGKRDNRNWYEIVEVVPQIDSVRNLNMNFLLKEGLRSELVGQGLRSRRETYPVSTYPAFLRGANKDVDFPFFVQCADARQDKFKCLSGIMEIQRPGFTNEVLNLPKGRYQDKCRCLLDSSLLKCDCEGVKTALKLPCELDSIEFDGSQLQCLQRQNLPAGSHGRAEGKGSCEDCYAKDGFLHCRCKNQSGYTVPSSVKIPCPIDEEISNVNGKLTCVDILKPLPEGSYLKSCRSCQYKKDRLSCDCGKGVTELRMPCDQGLEIENAFGILGCNFPPKPLPSGDYAKCSKCEYRGDILRCLCADNRFQLKLPCDADKEPVYFRETLMCARIKKPLPEGNYERSCRDCQYRGNVLHCSCLKAGSYLSTTLKMPCAEFQRIENLQGQLTCVDILRPLPPGSYRQTCTSCEYKGTTLNCDCGGGNRQSLTIPCPESQEILYRRSKLVCGAPSKPLPKGNYQKTCERCYSDGSTLDCYCRDTTNAQRYSTLTLPCEKELYNDHGKLMCK